MCVCVWVCVRVYGVWAADDVGFMRLIIDDVAARRRLDRARVYATGHSNGGYMSYRLACSASDVVAAVAPVSAGSPFLSGMPVGGSCRPGRAVPVLALHGNQDTVVAYSAGVDAFACVPVP
jgi:polyhydroxybutyrate depolymerase